MRVGEMGGVPIRLNPLALPMLALALFWGSGRELAILMASVMLHEVGHIAAARLLRVRVVELELMPVGGAARLENVWQLRPGQLVGVALAGPAVNFLIVLCCAACPAGRHAPLVAQTIRLNLSVMLFNLLPALPMDGGRIVCGLLARRLPAVAAARAGVRLGIGAACLFLGLAAYGMVRGSLNLTLLLAALFMMMTASSELRLAGGAAIESLIARRDELTEESVLPVRVLAVSQETGIRGALSGIRARQIHVFLCFDEKMKLRHVLSETELLDALMSGRALCVGDLFRDKKE